MNCCTDAKARGLKRCGVCRGWLMTLEERFAAKYTVDPAAGCWIWRAAKNEDGYGRIWVAGRNALAYKALYELRFGAVADGLELDHLCRNRACVNPEHLEPVPHVVNVLRSPATLNSIALRKTHCDSGHAFTAENTYRYKGARQCRACRRERNRARRSNKNRAESATNVRGAA